MPCGWCAAPITTSSGDIVPWAPPGAELPGGFKLERRRIRGQLSDGMLCAPDELGLSDDHSGIMILPPDTPLGEDLRTVLRLDDIVFDLEITPNRPDAMSIAGVARDLAAALGVPFTLPRAGRPGGHRSRLRPRWWWRPPTGAPATSPGPGGWPWPRPPAGWRSG